MAEDAEVTLSKMKVKELRAFAKHHRIGIKGLKKKTDIIEKIASHKNIERFLEEEQEPEPEDEIVEEAAIEEEEEPPLPEEEIPVFGAPEEPDFSEDEIRDALSGFKVAELKKLAKKHNIDISECKRKSDYLDALTQRDKIELIFNELDALEKERSLEKIRDELIDVGVDIEETLEDIEALPSMEDDVADRMLVEARNIDVDFNDVEDLLDFARMRFEEENYDKAVELSGEAIRVAENQFRDLLRLALAYQIMSNEKLIDQMRKGGRDFSELVSILVRSKEAYKMDRLDEDVELMNDLAATIRSLYSDGIDSTRESLYETADFLEEIENLGANLTVARDLFQKARDAGRRNDDTEATRLMERSKEVALEAKERRIYEIKEIIPRTEAIIEEARHLGADVGEAQKMLMQAKVALDNDDYILCAELAGRAEASAGEVQHYQIQQAMDIREKQINEAKKRIERLDVVISEGDSYRLNVSKARRLLYVAQETIREHDFVRMTRYVTGAQDAVDKLMPEILNERRKRGIEKPRAGICGNCKSRDLKFFDQGYGECKSCGKTFTWVTPPDKNVWQKVRSFFWE
ncbi:MAG: hypothetical protein KAW09_06805 [Thermoplasmata archaeon]|nr:hypothetical protein [Thermoplasmata archaeon]